MFDKIKIFKKLKSPIFTILIVLVNVFSLNFSLSQTLNFGYVTGNSLSDYARDVAIDSENNFIVVGTFNGTVDFDKSSNVFNLTSTQISGFIAKYKQNGDLIWAFPIQNNSSFVDINGVKVDKLDNIYVLSYITANSEVNPFGSSVVLNSVDGPLFVIKYDKNGNYIANVGSMQLAGGTRPKLTIDVNENIYVLSSYSGSFDIDPTSNTKTLNSNGLIDWFVSKYDSNLNFQTAFSFGGNGNEFANSILIDNNSNIYICGRFENSLDFDLGVGSNILTSTNGFDGYLVRYDKNINLIYCKQFIGTTEQNVYDIAIFEDNIYLCGSFQENIDTNPGIGVNTFNVQAPQNGLDIWFGKYKLSDMSYINSWHLVGDGTFPSEAKHILIDEWGYIYLGILGWGTIDFDPSTSNSIKSIGFYDVTLAKYTNNGDFIWSGFMSGGEIDDIANMEFDSEYNLIVCGNVRVNSINFNIEGGSELSAAIGNENIMFASYKLKVPPKLNIKEIKNINTNSFDINFNLLNNGNSNIQKIGLIIEENAEPDITNYDFIYYYDKDSIDFNKEIYDIYSNANYYIKAFAENEDYIGYSETIIIKTLPTDEDLAPNNGDANNDGTLDSRQDNVLSIKLINNKYVTIEEMNGIELFDPEIFEQREITKDYYFPFGEFGFKINSNIGKFKMYFSDISNFNKYVFRKRLSNDKYANKQLLEMGKDTINGIITSYIIFEVEDGSPFDYDGVVNGVIYDPGGPALLITQENIPTLTDWARIIILSSFVLFGVWWSRKRLFS